MWPSPRGGRLAYTYVGTIITETTRRAFGVPVNPHLFRSCLVEALANHWPEHLALATAILQHTDPRTTQNFYNNGAARIAIGRFHNVLRQIASGSDEQQR